MQQWKLSRYSTSTQSMRILHAWHQIGMLSRHLLTFLYKYCPLLYTPSRPLWHQIERSVGT